MGDRSEAKAYSWTQPLCALCWFAYSIGRDPGAEGILTPIAVADAEVERCVTCGDMTTSGIYIRLNPNITATLRRGQSAGEHQRP